MLIPGFLDSDLKSSIYLSSVSTDPSSEADKKVKRRGDRLLVVGLSGI
jgi:hypothetical protein